MAQIQTGGRGHIGAIVLRRDAPATRLDHWLTLAAPVDGFMGFAIGRSIWEEPIAGHIADQAGQEETGTQALGGLSTARRHAGKTGDICAGSRRTDDGHIHA